jgi:hypothetical protein
MFPPRNVDINLAVNSREAWLTGFPDRLVVVRHFPVCRLELSRPAADASREAVERWLLD